MKNSFFYRVVQLMLSRPGLQRVRLVFYFFDELILPWIKESIGIRTKKQKVVITFPLSLGDAVIFLNSISQIFTIFDKENYEVTIACQNEYTKLFEDFFEYVMPIDYRKSCVNPIQRIKMLKQIRKNGYDIAIDPIGCEECSPNVYFMNAVCAGKKIGVMSATDKEIQCPEWIRKKIYTDIIYIPIKNLHKVKYYTYFWSEYSGVNFKAKLIQFSYRYEKTPEHYFIVFPSASTEIKRWTTENFAEVTKKVYRQTKYPLVLCGTEQDREIVNKLVAELKEEVPYINLIGKTTIKEFIGLIGSADLVITNDTSTYHIAVMQKRKTCVVTGGYVYDTFINYECEEYGCPKPEIVCQKMLCMNCYNRCIYKVVRTYPCVSENTVEDVWNAVQRLLGKSAEKV